MELFLVLDSDGDGNIDRQEFLNGVATYFYLVSHKSLFYETLVYSHLSHTRYDLIDFNT